MVTTLNNDELEPRDYSHSFDEPPLVMNLVYGSTGWTDALSDAVLDVLLDTGAIKLDHTVAGPGWETRIFVSVKGKVPG